MRAAGFDEDDVDRVVWRNPVEFFAQSGRLILDDLGEPRPRRRPSRATRVLRGERADAAAPPRRQPRSTSRTAPTSTRPTTSTASSRSSSATPRRVRERLGVPRARRRPLGRRRRRARRRRPPRDAARARSSTALGLEVVTLNGFPYSGFHAPVVKRDVYLPDWTEPERRDYTLGARARCSRALLPDDVAEGSDLDAAARLARGLGRAAHAAARARARAASRPSSRALAGARPASAIRVALEPEPGCTVETIAQACDGARRARRRSGSASASTPATSRCSSRSPAAALDGARATPACRSSRRRSRARCASTSPRSRGGPRAARRASPSRASCTRCASA